MTREADANRQGAENFYESGTRRSVGRIESAGPRCRRAGGCVRRLGAAGQQQIAYASLGRLTADSHTSMVILNPGSGKDDHNSNSFNVE